MNLHAICFVKNEDDIIAESLTFASRHCERVFVVDNNSTDGTWAIVNNLARTNGRIVPCGQTGEPWQDGLRSVVYNEFHGQLNDDDWWLILDADEFLAEDPRPLMQAALAGGYDIVRSWQIQFYYTDLDEEHRLLGRDDPRRPVFERRRYYEINWQEPRLFRNRRDGVWDTSRNSTVPQHLSRIFPRRILNRHYQYRSPEQIDKRLQLRFGHPSFQRHVRSADWHSFIRPAETLTCHRDGDAWRFRFPGLFYYYKTRAARIAASKLRGVVRGAKRLNAAAAWAK